MAGFQFVHLNTYARKPLKGGTNTGFVFGEVRRKDGYCEHVLHPGTPNVVYGMDPEEVETQHNARAENAQLVDAKGKPRRIRQDQHTLLSVVASHPATPAECAADPKTAAAVDNWQELNIKWLKEQHGDNLVSVVRHDDEGHVHLHAYVLPPDNAMKARLLHPGTSAKDHALKEAIANGIDSKAANKIGDNAYKAAMRRWQDSYFETVGIPSGLARIGPGRRRLTQPAWKAEQAQVERVADLEARIQAAQPKVEEEENTLSSLKQQIIDLKKAKEILTAQVENSKKEADTIITKAKKVAANILHKAKKEAKGIRAGSIIGGLLQGLLGASPERVAERVAEAVRKDEDERYKKRESELLSANKIVRGQLREVIRERDEAQETLKTVVSERDDLRSFLHKDIETLALSHAQRVQ